MKGLSYRVRPGGLMRCCLLTLDEEMNIATEKPKDGDTLHCKWCDDPYGMVFVGGAWQWNKALESAVSAAKRRPPKDAA